ncbi:MAG: endonuclease V [bacterium]
MSAYSDLVPSAEAALAIQRSLAAWVRICPLPATPGQVAGADAAYSRDGRKILAVVVVQEVDTWKTVDLALASGPVSYPYVPGLLAFREGPALLRAMGRLEKWPDLVFFNGHGILHPRSLGLASHLGLLLNLPAIGCAEGPPSRGPQFAHAPGALKGSHVAVSLPGRYRDQGAIVRTRDAVKPVFVSPGHLVDLADSVAWMLRAARGSRLPEPLRQAHLWATRLRNDAEKSR